MNKKIYIYCFSLLISLFFAGSSFAQELAACDEGISILDEKTYQILSDVDVSDGDVAAYRQLLAGCIAMYPSFSTGRRDDFLRLLNVLMARVDDVYLRVSSEGLYLPEGASRHTELRASRILAIKRSIQQQYIVMLSQHFPLDKGWGDAFVSNLFVGYESVDVDGFVRLGGGRAGVNFYRQADVPVSREGGVALHFFGEAMVTSTAEHSVTSVDNAYELDGNLFMPYALQGSSKGYWVIGPVAGMKLKKMNGISDSRWKYMAGLRFARSPDLYIDGRYGKSEGVSGNRIELRAQLPVAAILNGDVIVGGLLNVSSDNTTSRGDSMLMYLLWQVNFLDVLNVY